MLSAFASESKNIEVARLMSLPSKALEAILISRGIPPEDLDEVEATLKGIGVVITPADAIRFTFTRTPIPAQRFNTIHFPAFYTALDEPTCLAEIKYHLGHSLTTSERRFYQFLYVTFAGEALTVAGHEATHPDLVSPSDAGYPFCQRLASAARDDGKDALYATSARCSGICVPIFSEPTISNASIRATVRFTFDGTTVQHEVLA
ncbi:RES family NAD+ phosphorylase [Bradyrhizobium sp. AUGA SZCCT0182]|uniref:RES family NAD+ phosphorylase n=1 Tax=Bradyrhizobium sp. AUGA SZCCT0182 TaxID=2807667 RepID=UPI001BA44E8D|nr:RES family NAD+ phosphorylase [Bradyrhizobium sp. AUGA SZCCT0182]MBR1235618.1 RES family NAD+ phosphorylase [Bradyrhizobium sp. AUGA SZCCT0182]